MRYSVWHQGVPIGSVDLPANRLWSGGLLERTDGFANVSGVLRDVANQGGLEAWAQLLHLPADQAPSTDGLSNAAANALTRAAALTFELRDEFGRAVPTDVVRLIDLNDGKGIRVRAYFREATTGPSAWLPPEEWQPGADNDSGV